MLNRFLVYVAIFQAVGFFPGVDTQPNYIVFCSIILVVFFLKEKMIDGKALFIFFAFVILFTSSLLFNVDEVSVKYTITMVTTFLTIVASYCASKFNLQTVEYKDIVISLSIYSFVAIVQFYVPDFLSFMVTRSEEAALSFSSTGRGVRSLTGEPAHFGRVYLCLNLLALAVLGFARKQKSNGKLIVFVSIFMFILNLSLSRSGYSIVFHAIFVYLVVLVYYPKVMAFLSLFSVSLMGLMLAILLSLELDFRFLKLIQAIFTQPEYILSQGAVKRLFNIPITINNIGYFWPFGAGSSIDTYYGTLNTIFGVMDYEVRSRVYGGLFELLLKLGIFGVIPFLTIIFLYVKMFIYCAATAAFRLIVPISFGLYVILVQDGSLSQPIIWLSFFSCYFIIKNNSLEFNSTRLSGLG